MRILCSMLRIAYFVLLCLFGFCNSETVWEKDASEEVFLPFSGTGFTDVKLQCLPEAMKVTVDLEESFDGVFYTRGSYKKGEPPCYYDADEVGSVSLQIPYNDCKTKDSNGAYVNTVILQHDDLLMFPGDAAFEVSCNHTIDMPVTASIGLADPDPSARELPKHKKSTVFGEDKVTFTPDDVRPRKKPKGKKKQKKKRDEL